MQLLYKLSSWKLSREARVIWVSWSPQGQGNFSLEVPSSQVTIVCVKLTQTNQHSVSTSSSSIYQGQSNMVEMSSSEGIAQLGNLVSRGTKSNECVYEIKFILSFDCAVHGLDKSRVKSCPVQPGSCS